MTSSTATLCPTCRSAHLNWRLHRTGRRGQPLTSREILWDCASCGATWQTSALDAADAGAPDQQLAS